MFGLANGALMRAFNDEDNFDMIDDDWFTPQFQQDGGSEMRIYPIDVQVAASL